MPTETYLTTQATNGSLLPMHTLNWWSIDCEFWSKIDSFISRKIRWLQNCYHFWVNSVWKQLNTISIDSFDKSIRELFPQMLFGDLCISFRSLIRSLCKENVWMWKEMWFCFWVEIKNNSKSRWFHCIPKLK